VPIALGLDGGGSIRVPASYCGVYGLKPSHGRVSQLPGISSASTTGVSGPIASTIEDLEIAYRVMARPDPEHHSSSLFAAPRPHGGERRKLIGVYDEWFNRADEPVRAICREALDFYVKTMNYELVNISIPFIPESQTAHAVTILSEIAASVEDISYLSAQSKLLVTVASRTPAAAFLRAQRMRNLLMQHLAALYEQHPGLIILTPTVPIAGWHIEGGDIGRGLSNGDKSIRSIEYASFANLTGLPALSIPVGYADPVEGEGKVPVGLMAMGQWGSEDQLIEWGREGERYLNEVHKGGRLRPSKWVDVLNTGKDGAFSRS
jgi:Asp-tRNA(Asn)/Glu-tRNA(Gln) amidotransferase A subunit family amidase